MANTLPAPVPGRYSHCIKKARPLHSCRTRPLPLVWLVIWGWPLTSTEPLPLRWASRVRATLTWQLPELLMRARQSCTASAWVLSRPELLMPSAE